MFKHILVATDLSPKARLATQKALDLAKMFSAKITFLSASSEFLNKEEMMMARVSVSKLEKGNRDVATGVREEMKRVVAELSAEGVNAAYKLAEGDADEEIVEFATKNGVDLIVMGTNGRDSIGDHMFGSTAEKVVRNAPCAVMVVPR
jgi:universal stress protein A